MPQEDKTEDTQICNKARQIALPDVASLGPPRFTGTLHIHQFNSSNNLMMWLVVLSSSAFALLTMIYGPSVIGEDSSGVESFGLLALAFVMFLVGAAIPSLVKVLIWPNTDFNADAHVEINSNGMHIRNFANLSWANILSLEGIPDSDTTIIVNTTSHKALLLTSTRELMLESILPTIKSYLLGKNTAPAICSADTVFRVAAFNWRRFRRRIVIGYAFGWSLGIAGAIYANSLLKSLVALFIFPFIIAYLIWEPALSGLSLGLAKKVNAFVIQGGRLISTDGTQSFDLTNAEVAPEKKSGLAYSLEFVTLTLKDGTKHYFLPYDNNWDTFVTALKSASHHG